MSPAKRVFIVGTDTEVGKTAVTAALLHTARHRGLVAIPFKPAQSGEDQPSDVDRLLDAAGLPRSSTDLACPLRYASPLAPGLAHDPAPFTGDVTAPPDLELLERVASTLDAWEERHRPSLTLVEGAGGLHVPMPGGTWQAEWITRLCARTLVIGRAGLGTINHTLATCAGLRAIGRPPLGFMLSTTHARNDPSIADNASVIARASGIPHLGTLPFGPPSPNAATVLLDALLERLGD